MDESRWPRSEKTHEGYNRLLDELDEAWEEAGKLADILYRIAREDHLRGCDQEPDCGCASWMAQEALGLPAKPRWDIPLVNADDEGLFPGPS